MLSMVTQDVGPAHVVRFHGSLDALTVPEVRARIDELLATGPRVVVVDLSHVTTIDSTGVALVVSMFKRLRADGGAVRVVGLQGQPREIFHFLKLDQSLPMAPSLDEALAGLG